MRTGSSWLCSILDSHHDIDCRQELLHHSRFREVASRSRDYLAESLFESSKAPAKGFKVLYHQMRGPRSAEAQIFAFILRDYFGCKIIHIRRNKLDTYVSHQLAKRAKIWNIFENSRSVNFISNDDDLAGLDISKVIEEYNKPITIDIDHFLQTIRKYEVWENTITELFPEHYEIWYEDLPNVGGVLDFLGIEKCELEGETKKLRETSLENLILNYDEVRAVIR